MTSHERHRGASLGQRITRVLMPVCFGFVLVGGVALHSAVARLLISQFDRALLTKARTLTSFPEPDRIGINLGFTEHPFPEFHGGPHAEYFQVWLSDGSILAKSPSLATHDLPRRIGTGEAPKYWALRLPDGQMGRAVGLQLNSKRHERDTFSIDLVLARDSSELDRVLHGLAVGITFAGGSLLLMVWFGVRKITANALRPVRQLARHVAGIDASSLRETVPVHSLPPDLQPIAEQINNLLKRLDAAFDRERRFAANAAHELLTPVSELQIAAENALDWPTDEQATSSLAATAKDISAQMEHVVRSLLALSRAEARMLPLKIEVFDLHLMLRELLGVLEPKLTARDLRVRAPFPGSLQVVTDQVILRSVLTNIFLNAIDYSREGSEIVVQTAAEQGGVRISIANQSAVSISSDELARFCEAFWRGDQSHQSRDHAGLGLALSQALIHALDGEFTLDLEQGNIFVVRMNLPVRPGNFPPAEPASPSAQAGQKTPAGVS